MATIKAGTYVFNETLDTNSFPIGEQLYIDFVSDNNTYQYMLFDLSSSADLPQVKYEQEVVNNNGVWINEVYRTVKILEDNDVDDTVYNFLSANWVKEEPQYKFVRLIREDEVSGIELNIAYGETAPEDTSKLWVSGAEPSKVTTAFKVEGEETFTAGVGALPTAAREISCASVGKKIYLFGGIGSANLNTINIFDAETNTVSTSSATLPTAAAGIASAVVGTKVYLFGGAGGSSGVLSTINCYDTQTNTITTLSTTYQIRYASAVAVGTDIYIFGGQSSSIVNRIKVFNTLTNTISTLSATLPTAAYYVGASAVGSKIYLFGGYDGTNRLDTISCFDTETKTISTISATLPTPAYAFGISAIGTKIYMFGGNGQSSDVLTTINCFDTETNTITTLSIPLSSRVRRLCASAVGTKIYLFGGDAGSLYNTISLFSIAFDLPTDNLLLHLSSTENLFKLINTDTASIEVGLQGVYRGNADGVGEMETAYLHDGTDWVEV